MNCKQNCKLIDKICNPATKRCVSKDGKIGKSLKFGSTETEQELIEMVRRRNEDEAIVKR